MVEVLDGISSLSFSFLNHELQGARRIADAELVFFQSTRVHSHARLCVFSRVRCVLYVRKRVHNATEQAQAKKYISTSAPQAQMYSPNYLRIAVPRSSLTRPSSRCYFFFSCSLSLPAHLHGMHSYEIDHSSADFSTPSLSSSLPLCLSSTHIPAMLVYAVTSSSSLYSTVNPTEDTRDVTCVGGNWLG